MENTITAKALFDSIKYYYFSDISESISDENLKENYSFFFKEPNIDMTLSIIKNYLVKSIQRELDNFVDQVSTSNEADFDYYPTDSNLKYMHKHIFFYSLLKDNKEKLINSESLDLEIYSSLGASQHIRK